MDARFDVETHNPLHDSLMYGVGIRFKVVSDHATITHVDAGSSAALSGMLEVGDVILSINDRGVRGAYCEHVAERYLRGRWHSLSYITQSVPVLTRFLSARQGTSLQLQVKGIRSVYGEPILQTITVSLVRGTAGFISLLRRRDELVQSNAVRNVENDNLVKRLSSLSREQVDIFAKDTANLPYIGSPDSRSMTILQPKAQHASVQNVIRHPQAHLFNGCG